MATTGRIAGSLWASWVMTHVGLAAPFLAAGALMCLAVVLFVALRRVLLETKGSARGYG